MRGQVLDSLLRDLREKNRWHATTGNQMTKYLYEVLGSEGLNDDAFCAASREDYPSIGYMLKHGATTIWERWELLSANHMNSHNHPMLGAFSVWFLKYLAGVRMDWDREKGLSILIAPGVPKGLDSARASIMTPFGEAACRWEKSGGRLAVDISLPWNAKAALRIPNVPADEIELDGTICPHAPGDELPLSAGRHALVVKML
jgi:alpha-L-rhamnosidase